MKLFDPSCLVSSQERKITLSNEDQDSRKNTFFILAAIEFYYIETFLWLAAIVAAHSL